jgi:hypothetical protein
LISRERTVNRFKTGFYGAWHYVDPLRIWTLRLYSKKNMVYMGPYVGGDYNSSYLIVNSEPTAKKDGYGRFWDKR